MCSLAVCLFVCLFCIHADNATSWIPFVGKTSEAIFRPLYKHNSMLMYL